MPTRIAVVILFTLICSHLTVAQHSEADPGLYNFNYHGDTWTGVVSSLDEASGAVTLTYDHKGKVQTFNAVIKPQVHIVDKNGADVPAQTHVKVGDHVTWYYIAQGLKYPVTEGGKKHDVVATSNVVFKIMLLDPKKH